MPLRVDKEALWENFLVSERRKQNIYKFTLARSYFWRTTQQQEIDFVENKGHQLHGYEFKWNPKKKAKLPKTFVRNYDARESVINRDNFREFVIL